MIVFLKGHGKEIYNEVRAVYVDTMNKVLRFTILPALGLKSVHHFHGFGLNHVVYLIAHLMLSVFI